MNLKTKLLPKIQGRTVNLPNHADYVFINKTKNHASVNIISICQQTFQFSIVSCMCGSITMFVFLFNNREKNNHIAFEKVYVANDSMVWL